MTGDDLRRARIKLGMMWGLGRAACAAELGRALGNPAQDPGETIRYHERARTTPVPWLLATTVHLLLCGVLPPGGVPKPILKGPPRRVSTLEMAQ